MIPLLFRLIIGSDSLLRGVKDKTGEDRFSVNHFINICKGRDEYHPNGSITYHRLVSDKSKVQAEILTLCKSEPLCGKRKTPTTTVKGLRRLLDILDSTVSPELRGPLRETLDRVIAGDRSLITEGDQEQQSSQNKNNKHAREAGSNESVNADETVKHLKTTEDFNVKMITSNQLMREHIPMREKILELSQRELAMDHAKMDIEINQRAKELETERAKMDLEDTKRAKELAFIKAKAVAEAEAIRILESARANPRNEPERPAVLQFLPVDHTTIKKTYEETYPKFKTPLKKDEENFLNDARTRANRAFKADHGGLPPQQVREDIRLVDAFPKSWEGVLNTLAGIHRERYGHTQRSIHSFIHIQSQPVD